MSVNRIIRLIQENIFHLTNRLGCVKCSQVNKTMIRRTINYSGHVQGVGFRFTVVRAARGYDVTGYVRNLPNGSVELVAEGDAKEVDRLAADIADRMSGYIHNTSVDTSPATGQYADFDIAY